MVSPLRIVPLGGLGEIGMNCMAVEHGDTMFAIDCGVTFPGRQHGVDLIHPDFSYLREHRDRFRALVLTHGHEDHIGGVPYLLREMRVPIHGPPYALELVKARLEEHGIEPPELRPTSAGRSFGLGSFEIEPVHVNHSIPDATALILRTPVGVVVHSGDFKIEERPPDGLPFDAERLTAAGDRGVRLLLSDSTNADVEGDSGEEDDVAGALERLVAEAPERVVVAVFASNVWRLKALYEAARKAHRKVCLLGRSVNNHARIAASLGHLGAAPMLVSPDRAREVPRDELLVIATGTQGEPPAALSRLARDTHPALGLDAGDTVVLSSRVIPGCEREVYAMIGALSRRGIRVLHRRTDPGIHVSGHACRDEQRTLLDLVRPTSFVPVHGTPYHLMKHADLARDAGVRDVLVVENGAIVELDQDGLRLAGHTTTGRVHVDRGQVVSPIVLRDRELLSELGIATVIVQVDRELRCVMPPEVLSRGFLDPEDASPILEKASRYVRDDLARHRRDAEDLEDVKDQARRALKRFFSRELGRKPLTAAVVLEIP